jgi:hypothetical protein
MKGVLRLAVFATLLSANSHAQILGTIVDVQPNGWAKAENGMILSWRSMAREAGPAQVDVSDKYGNHLLSLNLLRLVPDAATVDISDVSAVPGLIAAAVAYVSKKGSAQVRPTSALVLFDFSGNLVSFLSVAPWRDALRIELDADSTIWALNSIRDESNAARSSSMLVEYSAKGAVFKELLPRTSFPSHANEILGNSEIGFAAMGRDGGTVWFWLPGSTEFVTVDGSGGAPSVVKTGLPSSRRPLRPVSFARDRSGALIAEFGERESSQLVYYAWSPSARSWAQFEPGACAGGWLLGTDEGREIYLMPGKNRPLPICGFVSR